MRKPIFILTFLAIMSVSCQEEVFLDLKNSEMTPVIEGIWTDNSGGNQIRISYSKDFYDTLDNEVIEDAEVFILDEITGAIIQFSFVEKLGYYLPLNNQVGVRGREYMLQVKIKDNIYQSRGKILEPPTLDSLTFKFEPQKIFRKEGYYLTLYGKIPFKVENYYRVKITRNDTILNRRSDYLLFDDSFGTEILNNGFELTGYAFRKNDRVKLELFRLNKEVYNYFNQLISLLYNDGGLFSPPPENPPSNIEVIQGSGRVLGYFMTSPVVVKQVIIIDDD